LLSLTLALTSITVFASQATPGNETREALQAIEQAAEKIDAFEADIHMSMTMMNTPVNMKGTMKILKPDFMRMSMTMDAPEGTPPNMGMMNQEMVADASTVWIAMPAMKMVQKFDKSVFEKAPGGTGGMSSQFQDPSKMLEQLDSDTIQLIGEESCDGQLCYLFSGHLPPEARKMGGPFVPESMKIWVSKADGMARRMEMYQQDGKTLMAFDISNVKINPALTAGDFTFTPPEGVQAMDMTPMLESIIQGMQEGSAPEAVEAPQPEGE